MMLVKTRVEPSSVHGLGLFADEPIKAGTLLWRFHAAFDKTFSREELDVLPAVARDYVLFYCYLSGQSGRYVLCSDSGRYFNHSDDPNTFEQYHDDEVEGCTVALRDIEAGEELTCNYRQTDTLERGLF